MNKVIQVEAKPNYTLLLTFDDGLQGELCIADRLFGSIFEPLKDPLFFSQVAIDAHGVVCWPNDADLAPDVLYQKIKSQSKPKVLSTR